MAKSIPCVIICNTRNGYCLTPKKCTSIRQAMEYAKSLKLAYRIFVNNKLVKKGWLQ